ncbi:hypothetical protein BGM09_15480 [Streptomyces sp. CBMA29]|nr:hypothetical protein [Streptomyces sp. CBMA29]
MVRTERIWAGTEDPNTPAPFPAAWPAALRACLAEDVRFQADPDVGSVPDEDWERRRHESGILHRMFGLLVHAASSGNIDLAD